MLFFSHIFKENRFGELRCFFPLSGHKGEKERLTLKGYSRRRVCPMKARTEESAMAYLTQGKSFISMYFACLFKQRRKKCQPRLQPVLHLQGGHATNKKCRGSHKEENQCLTEIMFSFEQFLLVVQGTLQRGQFKRQLTSLRIEFVVLGLSFARQTKLRQHGFTLDYVHPLLWRD